MVVLRNVGQFVDRYPGYSVTPRVMQALERLAALPGANYGEVSLTAAAIISDFESRSPSSRRSSPVTPPRT